MPIFGEAASAYDEIVEKVTAETLTSENWELMIDICDRANADGAKGCKQCLLSIKKRLNHRDPHVVLLALSLLDCVWNNCGQKFRREVSSKEFISEMNYKCTNSNRVVAEKARLLIKKWSENECRQDASLSLVESLYKELQEQGHSFESDPVSSAKKKTTFSTDPNVVTSDQEEADIARAIALSLKESSNGSEKQQQFNNKTSAYPTIANVDSGRNVNTPMTYGGKQVRALYDFEAAEDNEISFSTGEMISVYDDSDQNWWRGANSRGVNGLFPSSFVTTNLNGGGRLEEEALKSKEQSGDGEGGGVGRREEGEAAETSAAAASVKVQIDESVILKCINLIEGLDPALDASSDPDDLLFIEHMALSQVPLIDRKLTQIDKQLNLLAEVDLAIRDVLGVYDCAVVQQAATSTTSSAAMLPPSAGGSPHVMAATVPSSQNLVTSTAVPSVGLMQQQHQATAAAAQWPQQQMMQ